MVDKELFTEVATIERDINRFVFGAVMDNLDDTLKTRGGSKGLKLYDEIERDPHAYAVLHKRKSAVIAREYVVEPASQSRLDRKAADLVREQISHKRFKFDRTSYHLLDAVLKGFAVGEVMWELIGDQIVATGVKPRDARRFKFDRDGKPRLLTRESPFEGIAVPDRKFLVHSFGGKDGSPYGLGLGGILFWPVFFKKMDMKFWLTFLDKFGMPTVVGEYPPESDKSKQDDLFKAAKAVAHDSAVIYPQGMVLKLLEMAQSGATDAYERMCRYLDEQISEAVLGETLTTNIGTTGSKAAAETHNDVRIELVKFDADLLSETLNDQIAQWIVYFNLPIDATPPSIWRQTEPPEDLEALADRDTKVSQLGYRPTLKYIRERYGEDWEPKEAPVPTVEREAPAELASFAEGDAPESDLVDQFVDRADAQAADFMEAIVAPVRDLVQSAGSLEEIRDGLLARFPKMDSKGLGKLMEQAFTASHLGGKFEAGRGD